MKAALYARVSTRKKDRETDEFIQNPENQMIPMQERCVKEGWTIVEEFIERETATGRVRRKVFSEMMAKIDERKFDVLLFWSFDRFSREGPTETLLALRRISQAGVKWVSVTEPYLDTSQPFGEAIVAVIAAIANQESKRRSERAKAAIVRRRARGLPVGRQSVQVDETRLWALYTDGRYSINQIARALNVGRTTVYKALRRIKARIQEETETGGAEFSQKQA